MQVLEIEDRGDVRWVWLNRPEAHNALDEELVEALASAFRSVEGADSVSAVVLSGRGKSFCAGADTESMQRQGAASPMENLQNARTLAEMFRLIAFCPKPTIARINGAAIGGGLGLACCCDIAVATTQARFATSEVRLGLIPATIAPYVVRTIGERWARRLFLTGERITATMAKEIHLVNDVVGPDELDGVVEAITANLRTGAPNAQQQAKELIDSVAGRPISPELIDDTAMRIAHARALDEANEGLSAFLEKRAPRWAARS